jgi:topoisomerase-4 subunit B
MAYSVATDSCSPHLLKAMAKTATKKKPSKQPDLFDAAPRAAKSSARKATARGKPARGRSAESGYTAKHIEVLEGLEPVRRRPGM